MATNLSNTHVTALERLKRGAIQHFDLPVPDFANTHEEIGYALWCKESKEIERAEHAAFNARAIDRVGRGKVLTDKGWEIPTGKLNPRLIEHDPKPITGFEARYEDEVQRQVKAVADSHEYAVKRGDIVDFIERYRKWDLPFRFYWNW